VHNDDKDDASGEGEDKAEGVQTDDEDAANGATNEDEMLPENMQGNEAKEHCADVNTVTGTATESE